MDEERCCGRCKWHKLETVDSGYVCTNSDSEYCSDWTEYGDCCKAWEEDEA